MSLLNLQVMHTLDSNFISPSQFLFGEDAKKLKEEFKEIDAVLGVLEERAVELFSQGQLVFFDAISGNNQCHLIALMVVHLYQQVQANQLTIKVGKQTPENQFLQLAFLVNALFIKNKEKMLGLLISEKSKSNELSNKNMAKILSSSLLIQAARLQLAEKVKDSIQLSFKERIEEKEKIEETTLIDELDSLSKEKNLCHSQGEKENTLYCFPKFAGVQLLVQQLESKQIPLIFKAKILCTKGSYHSFTFGTTSVYSKLKPIDEMLIENNPSVLVIEGFSSGKTELNRELFEKIRATCPHGLYGDRPGAKNRYQERVHSLKETCPSCNPCKEKECEEVNSFLKNLEKCALTARDLLSMISADFTSECQPNYVKRFFNSSSYPKLKIHFYSYLNKAKELGFSSENPSTFLIEHVYPDSFEQATKNPRLLDTAGQDYVKSMQKQSVDEKKE